MDKRKPLSKKLRFEVFKRDRFQCQYCGRIAPDVVLEVDHIIPIAEDGCNEITNLITACFDCNRGKGKRTLANTELLKKTYKETSQLAERKAQLEMMMEWKLSLSDMDSEYIEKINIYISSLLKQRLSLTKNAEKEMLISIKKYGIEEVLESIRIAIYQYKDVEESISKSYGIMKSRKMANDNIYHDDAVHLYNISKKQWLGNLYFNKIYSIFLNLLENGYKKSEITIAIYDNYCIEELLEALSE